MPAVRGCEIPEAPTERFARNAETQAIEDPALRTDRSINIAKKLL
jgi:hypothetical protein